MTKNIHDNNNNSTEDAPDSSGYIESLHAGITDFSEYLGDRYSNITPLYESATGPMVLYTAVRYGKRYILKGLKESSRKDPVYNLVLRKEFEIGISIDHPHIRRTLGFEEIPETGWVIVLEYIDGITLDRAIEDGRVNASNARRIALQLADAIKVLHSRQMIHRDLKPANILITFNGDDAKIIDMSLADSESYLILKSPAGTRNYMAPELFEPQSRPSVASDIYSYGLIIRQLGSLGNDQQLLSAAEKCSAPNPEARPQSVAEIQLPSKPFKVNDSRPFFSIDSPRLSWLLGVLTIVLGGTVLFLARSRGML